MKWLVLAAVAVIGISVLVGNNDARRYWAMRRM